VGHGWGLSGGRAVEVRVEKAMPLVQATMMGIRVVALGAVALFDLTGVVIYALMRRALVAPEPDRSAIEPFRKSALTISAAYQEAVGGIRSLR
jgi:hypothetical protein